ncbi:3-hydroxyacyl-CoA dehydrogenase NAD-binding domain-containing protein [Agrobacterium sp. SOY23]|uniref:3-hydroxyacyl-CoA dehydrogenase NAD-binding domain-containing protein n=1 Tax=Agrobacterium sp. SOY23 TaxID=3014555 RepID=UPI0022B01EEA|nr:3-hydroxyacyl-CoA dehydrogenase NAD-binding domain-containing protein [Agrobacterium sp. SOY23]MCZ4431918.1 3-hydroxyacyl-CoA dehydrogenase NAD-binding domain-containing protein [Agrobacterium sp. SOY23]
MGGGAQSFVTHEDIFTPSEWREAKTEDDDRSLELVLVDYKVEGRVALVTIDNPPVNALNQQVRQSMLQVVEAVEADGNVDAVVLACAGRTFVAGADINELGNPLQPYLPDLLKKIDHSRKPWVAAVHGTTLGGGLELAMACHGRVAQKGTKLGLPEVSLGVIPGSGGTVRLPRLIPLEKAITLITTGKPISAEEGLTLGLVDKVAEGDLVGQACLHACSLIENPVVPLLQRAIRGDEAVDWEATQRSVSLRGRGAMAPVEALAALKDAVTHESEIALASERQRFLRLAVSDESRALKHIFFAERNAGKSLRNVGGSPVDLSHVGVIGGGTMGAGIASALLLAGSAVTLVEQNAEAALEARERVRNTIAQSAERKVINAEAADWAVQRFSTVLDYDALKTCPLVIEAVFEDMAVKRDVFAKLDAVMPASAILATNTSYLDVDRLAASTAHPERILGLHFFSPAHVMKLLEIVRGERTGSVALSTAHELAKRLRKIPVVSGVCDGFIGNRIMAAYRRDCEFMLEEGALPSQIDAAMRDFGFAMGIFEVQDMSGLDIAWAQRKARAASHSGNERIAHIADRLCEAGRFGKKTGRGWFDYRSGKPVPDDEVVALILEESKRGGFVRRSFTEAEIMNRILSTIQREGRAVINEGIAETADDIDVVLINGYGFPRHKGGPMYMADAAPSEVRTVA